jgi:hypothetical protein
MFVRTPQPGLWFIAGSLAQCRIYSKYLGLQIKASEIGCRDPKLADGRSSLMVDLGRDGRGIFFNRRHCDPFFPDGLLFARAADRSSRPIGLSLRLQKWVRTALNNIALGVIETAYAILVYPQRSKCPHVRSQIVPFIRLKPVCDRIPCHP